MSDAAINALLDQASAQQRAGKGAEAIPILREAVKLRPGEARIWNALGCALCRQSEFSEGVTALRKASELEPERIEFLLGLAAGYRASGEIEEAIAVMQRVVALRPDDAEPMEMMADLLRETNRLDEAVAAFGRVLELRPRDAKVLNSLSVTLRESGRWDRAINAGREAVEIDPSYAGGWNNLSITLAKMNRMPEAIAAAARAFELEPKRRMYEWNLATALLKGGRLEEGFRHAQARWQATEIHPTPRHFNRPQWDGSDLGAQRLLLHTDQGIGDTLQFIRYLPLVVERVGRAGRIIFECPPPLVRLLAPSEAFAEIVVGGDALPDFDVQRSLMDLALVFKTTLETIPANVPYLQAEPTLAAGWQARVAAAGEAQLKVAIVWAGNPMHNNDHRRSIDPSLLKPLAQVPGVRLFSLQTIGQRGFAANAHAMAMEMGMINWTAELRDFADTAALLANLDLLICVDTAVAHLAGGLGKPVWVLLPTASDWRWLTDRTDSPWYPTMRLFRQEVAGDWGVPIARITELLRSAAQGGSL
jgi:Flp pilus assembly protein TadD